MKHNFFKHVVYDLTRRYGVLGEYYHILGTTGDLKTGASVPNKVVYKSRKMVELPTDIVRDIKIGGSTFSGAQEVDISATAILINHHDLPSDFQWRPDDYIILYSVIRRKKQLGRRFNVERIQTLEDNSYVMAIARFIQGSPLQAIHEQLVSEKLGLSEEVQ